MEVFEVLNKVSPALTTRKTLVPAEKNNGVTPARRCGTKEVSSRYRSPTPTNSRRNGAPALPSAASKRALSAEKRRPSSAMPSTPVSDTSAELPVKKMTGSSMPEALWPSTLVSDTSAESQLPANKMTGSSLPEALWPSTPVSDTSAESQLPAMTGSRLPEALWPSTMRSLSVSFQSDNISIPVVKKKQKQKEKEKEKEKEKPAIHVNADRTLRPTSNVTQKQVELNASPRKPTPERKRSPLKGKNLCQQSENSRPVDSLPSKLIDQHRWPSLTGGRLFANNIMTRSIELTDRTVKTPNSSRRLSVDGIPRCLYKTSSNSSSEQSESDDQIGLLSLRIKSVDDSLLQMSVRHNSVNCLNSSAKMTATNADSAVRFGSVPGSHLPSPSRVSMLSRGSPSPSKMRPSIPTQARGPSPSRIRPSSPTRQSSFTTSVLSFIADIKKGKKNNQIEEVHQLRLLYNRYLQWRFANARAETALYIQKITAEQTLYNVLQANLELWDSVIRKRIDLQQLNLQLKLTSVLSEQMEDLEDWALIERDHSTSLNGAIRDLQACTLRLPLTGGAKIDIDSLKVAINSAVNVMQAMGSSICSLLSKVEEINGLVSDLSELAGQERTMLNECEALLGSTSALQVQECSLRTQFIQAQQDVNKPRHPLLWST